jgi:SPP1 gp7 family putative phage head morphogenesis protein
MYKVMKTGRILTLAEEDQVCKTADLTPIRQRGYQYYRIVAENDSRLCSVCQEQDGNVYAVSAASAGVNLPPFHPNCRCTVEGAHGANPNFDPWLGERQLWENIASGRLTFLEICRLLEERYGDFSDSARADFARRLAQLYRSNPEMAAVIEAFGRGSFAIPPLFQFDWDKKGLPSTEHVTIQFMLAVIDVAKRLQINPDDLMAVMAYESWTDPQRVNSQSGAIGLIQFTQVAINEINRRTNRVPPLTRDVLAQMTAIEQLEYVYYHLLFNGGTGARTVSDLYMAVLWPSAVNEPDDEVIMRAGDGYYEQNRGLDLNNDGEITKGEVAQRVIDRRDTFERSS